MHLKIVTAIHGREKMTRAFIVAMNRIKHQTGVETHAVVTHGDVNIPTLGIYGIPFVTSENKPVSKKFNAVVESLKEKDWTHLMILGSDDIPNTRLVEHALTLDKWDYCGIDGLWFWGLNPRRAGFDRFGYFKVGGIIAGTAKVISRRVMDAVDYRPWTDDRSGGMDGSLMKKTRNALAAKGESYTAKRWSLSDVGGFLMDVKYESHVSSMSPITRQPALWTDQDPYEVLPKYLPESEVEYFRELHEGVRIIKAQM